MPERYQILLETRVKRGDAGPSVTSTRLNFPNKAQRTMKGFVEIKNTTRSSVVMVYIWYKSQLFEQNLKNYATEQR